MKALLTLLVLTCWAGAAELDPQNLKAGDEGRLPITCRYKVRQVVNEREVLINPLHRQRDGREKEGADLWVTGIETKGMVDDAIIESPLSTFRVQTKTYRTAIGSQRTVFELVDITAEATARAKQDKEKADAAEFEKILAERKKNEAELAAAKTYVLADGTTIKVIKAQDFGGTELVLKDTLGKMHTVKKSDVKEIRDP